MYCDLRKTFESIRMKLPGNGTRQVIFSSNSFNGCPDPFETDQLVITKGIRVYRSGYRSDRLNFYASRVTFQELGLLILSVVFRPGGEEVNVKLTNRASTIKNLVVKYDGLTLRTSGYKTKPSHFCFSPEPVGKYPWDWSGKYWSLYAFPSFTLTNMNELMITEDEWVSRDTVKGFGNDDASVCLADLLLNIGYSEPSEFILEGEGGIRGVGMNSAEAVFYCYDTIEDAVANLER